MAVSPRRDGVSIPSPLASIVVALLILLGGPRLMGHVDGAPPAPRQRMTAPRFDEIIHPSTRLSIVALLAAADWVDFAFVRDQLGLSDSALSKQFATLEEAGYIAIERPRHRVGAAGCSVRLTPAGREAFEGHVAALREIVAAGDAATAS